MNFRKKRSFDSRIKLFKTLVDSNGYSRIRIPSGWMYEHRYVWELKNGKIPKGYVIHHVDGNRLNNNIENLRMITKLEHDRLTNLENTEKRKQGLMPKIKHSNQRDFDKSSLVFLLNSGKSIRQIAKIFNVTHNTIRRNLKDYGIQIIFDRKTHTTKIA